MKELHGTATAVVTAPLPECVALLEAVDRYPSWHPEVVKEVTVLDRDDTGRVTRANATLHVAVGPLTRDFHLEFDVSVQPPGAVTLRRVPHQASDKEEFDVAWRVEDVGDTRISLRLDANLSVPRLMPLGGVGDSLAQGFVGAAVRALRS
jgi:hypothetical protein